MRNLVIATGNQGKFEEIKAYLVGEFDKFYSFADFEEKIEVVEDRPTYYENAVKKARIIGDRFGLSVLADDSGLEVSALDGRPGIYSSRYGTDDKMRIDRLLGELEGVPLQRRKAQFKAYLAYYKPASDRTCLFYGCLPGYIGFERKGEGGFGFDPLFMLPDSGKSLAQLPMIEKNRISHRGRALAAFKAFLNEDLIK